MRGNNKLNAPQNLRKAEANALPRRIRNAAVVVNPEVNANRAKNGIQAVIKSNRNQSLNKVNAARKLSIDAKGLNRFKVTPPQVQPKQSTFTTPKLIFSQPAPYNQFKKYLTDSENVFYEDSSNMKALRRIKVAKVYLTIFVIIMTIMYIGIGRIVPFRGKCPQHADCNVFIHCHEGYARRNNTCIIDPQIVNKAKEISEAVVMQLKYNFGEGECRSGEESPPISTKIQDIFSEFHAEDQILRNQIIYFFLDKENQQSYEFSFRYNTITAQSKLYSLSCSTSLFICSSSFKYYMLSFVLLIFGAIRLFKYLSQYKKAKQTYHFLKRKTLCENELCVSSAKRESENLFGTWTSDLWRKVDQIRSKDGCIAYYIELEQLYWKRLD